ncbi:hypothetical protein ACVPOS_11200 [Staphylococcus aureus]
MSFIAIFIIAALSGLVSFIPGGFGAFDLVVLLGFKTLGLNKSIINATSISFCVLFCTGNYWINFIII